jgi:hypothetical protein
LLELDPNSKIHRKSSPEKARLCWDQRGILAAHISGTAVLEYGPTETLSPVSAKWKALRVSADPVANPAAHTRAEAGVLDLRKRMRESYGLSAGGSRIRTLSLSLGLQQFCGFRDPRRR